MCPFCYIGKRRFESALDQFAEKDKIEVVWKSFQLSPDMKTDPTISIHDYLAAHKGISPEEAKRMNDYVSDMAAKSDLVYHLDKAVVANSFKAHRMTHFAKHHGKQGEAEEKLFQAYFCDGKNIDDTDTLVQLGTEIGLDKGLLKAALNDEIYADDVRSDIYEAHQVGVQGVPFFLFNGKYAVSGAQPIDLFTQTLEKSFSTWQERS